MIAKYENGRRTGDRFVKPAAYSIYGADGYPTMRPDTNYYACETTKSHFKNFWPTTSYTGISANVQGRKDVLILLHRIREAFDDRQGNLLHYADFAEKIVKAVYIADLIRGNHFMVGTSSKRAPKETLRPQPIID